MCASNTNDTEAAHSNKAVADGALSFYLDHFVSVRVARVTYGACCTITFEPNNAEHKRRSHKLITRSSGNQSLPDSYMVILEKGTRVSEEKEFRRTLIIEKANKASFGEIYSDVTCYRGKFEDPRWVDTEPRRHLLPTPGFDARLTLST